MGYEVTYHYREEENGILSEDVKTKTVKIGTHSDDTPIDVCAGKIMGQLARRNIVLEDVEIYEYTKKKLSFKQLDDGIQIGKRKFDYDDGPPLGTEGVSVKPDPPQHNGQAHATNHSNGMSAEQILAALLQNPTILSQLQGQNGQALVQAPVSGGVNSAVKFKPNERPIRHEIYNPVVPGLVEETRRRGIALTLGKQYPIYSEKPGPGGIQMVYTTVDDNGIKRTLSDKLFTPEIGRLERDVEGDSFKTVGRLGGSAGDPRLDWGGGMISEQIPDIRGIR